MDLKKLSDLNLLSHTKLLAAKERKITSEVIKFLAEIDRHKLFAELGHSSLFSYCTGELKMSEGQAHRRIQAARLSREIPEVGEKIEQGELSLSGISQMMPHFKQKGLDVGEKKEILKQMEGKSRGQVEKLAQELWGKDEVPAKDAVKMVSKTQHELTITVDEETLQLLRDLKAEMVHKGVKDLGGVIKALCKDRKRAVVKRARISKVDPANPSSRTIPAGIRRQVIERAKHRCEFTVTAKGAAPKVCGSKFGLELDHVRPYCQGGTHELSNLRLLCHQHHARESFKVFGQFQ